MCKLVSYVRMA